MCVSRSSGSRRRRLFPNGNARDCRVVSGRKSRQGRRTADVWNKSRDACDRTTCGLDHTPLWLADGFSADWVTGFFHYPTLAVASQTYPTSIRNGPSSRSQSAWRVCGEGGLAAGSGSVEAKILALFAGACFSRHRHFLLLVLAARLLSSCPTL